MNERVRTLFADRGVSTWTRREKIRRFLWSVVETTLFRYSFHTMYGWRRFLLRRFGARIGEGCLIRRTAHIEIPWHVTLADGACLGDYAILYALGPISLGERVSISQYAHLCAGTHDHTRMDMPLQRPPIVIEDDAWIGADAFVGPNVTVGEGAILGARGCAFKNLEPWTIYGGNPAVKIGPRELDVHHGDKSNDDAVAP